MHGLIQDIGIAVVVATFVGVISHKLRQPIILAYLIAGIIIGPYIGPQLVHDPAHIEIISEIGLVLLLFIIGLEMNPQHLARGGRAMLVTGLGQVPVTILIGTMFFVLIGYSAGWMDALYLSIACSLSSTAIVVKALFDKFEINSVSGRLTVGVLIFQDIWAILLLALQPTISNPGITPALIAILKAVVLLAAGFLISRYLLSIVFEWLSRAPEMVVAVAIGWCALYAGVASYAGLSYETGALIAGVSLSSFAYSEHITEKTLPLRDFFLTLFFVSLGMKIPLPESGVLLKVPLIIAFVIVSRLLIVIPLARAARMSKRASFLAALNLSQIGEFALVIAAAGIVKSHIEQETMSLILYALAITSILSSYMLKYNHEIYRLGASLFPGLFSEGTELEPQDGRDPDIVILGFHRTARAVLDELALLRPDLLARTVVVDFSVEVLRTVKERHPVRILFGDISAQETLVRAHAGSAKWILCTIPDTLLRGTNNMKLVRRIRDLASEAHIVATAESRSYVDRLIVEGASDVLLPFVAEGEKLAAMVARTVRSPAPEETEAATEA